MNEVVIPDQTRLALAPTVAWTPLGENAILIMSACDAIPGKVPVAVDGNPRNRADTMVLSWRRPQAEAAAAVGFLCLAPAPARCCLAGRAARSG
jgi:O-antigen biosynthesis protein